MELINRVSKQWVRALRHDHQFKLLKVTSGTTHGSGVAVLAYLFEKR
jgi:hypothetical protein